MYSTRSLRFIVPALLGIALAASPASAYSTTTTAVRVAQRPAIVGLYNLTFVAQTKYAEQHLDLILEHGNTGYTALLVGPASATALDTVTFDGEILRAGAATNAGRGDLTLHFTDDGISGTLVVGTHTITIKGTLAQR